DRNGVSTQEIAALHRQAFKRLEGIYYDATELTLAKAKVLAGDIIASAKRTDTNAQILTKALIAALEMYPCY
ncbi:hypothetical protein, partial [Parvimonas sp. D9]